MQTTTRSIENRQQIRFNVDGDFIVACWNQSDIKKGKLSLSKISVEYANNNLDYTGQYDDVLVSKVEKLGLKVTNCI